MRGDCVVFRPWRNIARSTQSRHDEPVRNVIHQTSCHDCRGFNQSPCDRVHVDRADRSVFNRFLYVGRCGALCKLSVSGVSVLGQTARPITITKPPRIKGIGGEGVGVDCSLL